AGPRAAGDRVVDGALRLVQVRRVEKAEAGRQVLVRRRRARVRLRAHQAMVLRSAPTPVTSTVTTSPDLRNSGGVRRAPTPDGVPVRITSPGRSSGNSE